MNTALCRFWRERSMLNLKFWFVSHWIASIYPSPAPSHTHIFFPGRNSIYQEQNWIFKSKDSPNQRSSEMGSEKPWSYDVYYIGIIPITWHLRNFQRNFSCTSVMFYKLISFIQTAKDLWEVNSKVDSYVALHPLLLFMLEPDSFTKKENSRLLW